MHRHIHYMPIEVPCSDHGADMNASSYPEKKITKNFLTLTSDALTI